MPWIAASATMTEKLQTPQGWFECGLPSPLTTFVIPAADPESRNTIGVRCASPLTAKVVKNENRLQTAVINFGLCDIAR